MGMAALPESCSRLTPLFQGALCAVDDWRCAGHDTPGRREEWCADDRVVITRRGAWELEIAGTPSLADPGTATFWNREMPYRVRHPIGGRDDCTLFRLTAGGSEALRGLSSARGPTFAHRARPLDGPGYLLHRRVLDRARSAHPAADPLAIEEPTLALLWRLSGRGAGGPGAERLPGSSRRAVRRAREVIAGEFLRPLTVSAIAREAGCSPFHLSRLFRRATGVSLHRAVVRLRLREGLERVLDEPGQLARIALETGFASHSHFTDAFRAEYRCSPSQARGMSRASTGRR